MNKYTWRYQFLTDKVDDLFKRDSKKHEALKLKADELKTIDNQASALTREHLRRLKELSDKEKALAEEIEAELVAIGTPRKETP